MRFKIPLLFSVFSAVLLFSGCSLNSLVKKADKMYGQGEYFKAANLYYTCYSQTPYTQKPLKARIAYNQAECYRLLGNNKALQCYANAIKYKCADSLVFLHYAQMLQRGGKYAEAKKFYTRYLYTDSTSVVALNGIAACNELAENKWQPTRYLIKKADLFNTRFHDNFSPAFLGQDADVIVFTSSRQVSKKSLLKNSPVTGLPSNNLFSSRKDAAGRWEKPVELGEEINSPETDEGVASFSFDGKTMYFTRASQGRTEIFTSNRAGGTWSAPQKLKIFADSSVSVGHPAISPDGQTLYFVSDEKQGLGGKDIWKATIEGGTCKFIENLGSDINTSGDEMFPTMRADGTLYFSSDGRPGYGGLDVFKAAQSKDGKWVVKNMGDPINSTADDFGMTFAGNAEKGYFTSNRGETKGFCSLWSFELPELAYILEGKVVDDKDTPIPDATVRLISSTGTNVRVQTKKDGTYRIKLDKDMDCVMMASARGYLNQKNDLSTMGLTDSKSFTKDFKLSSISKPVQIDNIFYEFGKWDLTPASAAGLQVLVKLLKDNPNITIELSANTDMVGNNDANKVLSEKRAKSVVDYLIAAGIAADRLTAVGNGEEKPVIVDARLAKKYPFLKENDVLDEAFVTKLTPEQQEVANQINRRTEFRVLKTTYKLY